MSNRSKARIVVAMACLFFALAARPASTDEQTIWALEHDYWRYVQSNDLSAYLRLWHKDFLGWPSMSSGPVRKEHITDWITSQTSNGLTFKLVEFKPAALQTSGDVVVVCYWLTYQWLDKQGNGLQRTLRVTHTWVKTDKDWQIVGGMSMLEKASSDSRTK